MLLLQLFIAGYEHLTFEEVPLQRAVLPWHFPLASFSPSHHALSKLLFEVLKVLLLAFLSHESKTTAGNTVKIENPEKIWALALTSLDKLA